MLLSERLRRVTMCKRRWLNLELYFHLGANHICRAGGRHVLTRTLGWHQRILPGTINLNLQIVLHLLRISHTYHRASCRLKALNGRSLG